MSLLNNDNTFINTKEGFSVEVLIRKLGFCKLQRIELAIHRCSHLKSDVIRQRDWTLGKVIDFLSRIDITKK